jgi:hypothetical protein
MPRQWRPFARRLLAKGEEATAETVYAAGSETKRGPFQTKRRLLLYPRCRW